MATSDVNILRIRVGIELRTNRGLESMVGPLYETDPDDLFIESGAMGIVSYPDQRVTKFRIYAQKIVHAVEGSWHVAEFSALKANHNELSYAVFGTLVGSRYGISWLVFEATYPTIEESAILALPSTVSEVDPNLVLVSDPYQPRMLYARSALTVGNDADDAVLAFESNAIPVSSGQYGEYPVAAFCRRSIKALRAGEGEVAFTSIAPLTSHRGIIGRKAIANIGGQIYYVAEDGLFRLGDKNPVSSAVQYSGHPHDLLRNVTSSTAIGYFVDPPTGRRELWISTPLRMYALALEHGIWFTLSGTRRQFFTSFGDLWGIDNTGIVRESGTGGNAYRRGIIQTTPIHMGTPEVMKRWRKVIARFSGEDMVALTQVSDYDITVQIVGATLPLLSLDFLVEGRYTHRVRLKRSNRIVVSMSILGGAEEASTLASLGLSLGSLQKSVSMLSVKVENEINAVKNQLYSYVAPIVNKGRLTGVNKSGAAVTFLPAYPSADAYIPEVHGVSADHSHAVTVGAELSAGGMFLKPSEDNATIYWRVEGL